MKRCVVISDDSNFPVPSWAMFWAFDDTKWNKYFEDKEDAIHFARLNNVIVKDLVTDEIIFDSFTKGEDNED